MKINQPKEKSDKFKNKFILLSVVSLLFLFSVFITPFSSATDSSFVFKASEEINLKVTCFDTNNTYCNNATQCLITILYPNATTLINNQYMTWNAAYHNYTLNPSQTSTIGEYSVVVNCLGLENGYTTFNFEISPSGVSSTSAGSIFGFGIAIGLLVVALFFMFGASEKQPYIKMLFWFLGFLFVILSLALSKSLADEYIKVPAIVNLFKIAYIISIWIFIFMFIYTVIMFAYQMITEKKQREERENSY
jgi:hypothetical protein